MPAPAITPAATAPGSAGPALAVRDLTVRFGPRTVLDRVSFTIAPGEFAGLIGSNGAGKTTLLKTILGQQPPSAGGVDRGAEIGYVPQKFLLDPDMPLRGRDLIGLGLDGNKLGLPRPSRARRAAVQEMIEAVDATAFADARLGSLSGGEQQRILIAHALISRPRLLLLDEPLANLDLRSAKEVVDLLARIAHEQRIAVLLSAHEMNALLPVLDQIIYIADGRAVSGAPSEVVTTEVLTRLYGHHVDVLNVHGRVIVVAGDGEQTLGDHGHAEIV
jgi:zinc/manganese transport system ATP-binding protein